MHCRLVNLVAGALLALMALGANAADVQVAVASNFIAPMQRIAAQFHADTGHRALLSFGATGKFYAQIVNGAPFDVLLAADARTPERLEREGRIVAGSRFTYAIGKLVLWSAQVDFVDAHGDVLRHGDFRHIAIASPNTAPYGAAAIETLTALGLIDDLRARFVTGENISQTYQFVFTSNAALGFVALSQVMDEGRINAGSAWLVPSELYSEIRQDAVVLQRGADNPAAHALLDYLRTDKAARILRDYGYER